MPKIITITGNLLAEWTSEFEMPSIGETARAKNSPRFQVGGKGVNVSRAVSGLGGNSIAVIFPAGHLGNLCQEELVKENFADIISTYIDGETRMGLVAIDSLSGKETTFLNSDVPISDEIFKEAMGKIENISQEGDILALCGSFPQWNKLKKDSLLKLITSKKLLFCADTYGLPLKDLLQEKSEVFKINRKELFMLKGIPDNASDSEFEDIFNEIQASSGARLFAVSDGPKPTLARIKGEKTIKINPPKIEKEVSATGCGDVMFATLIHQFLVKNNPPKIALESAVALASKMAQSRKIFDSTLCNI